MSNPCIQSYFRFPRWPQGLRHFRSEEDSFVSTVWLLAGLLLLAAGAAGERAWAADTTSQSHTEETNTQEMIRSYLQLQEQLHATQLAIEQNRRAADAASAEAAKALAEHSKVLSSRLSQVESAISTQRSKEIQAAQTSNQILLIISGAFVVLGFVAVLLMAWFQWRTVNRLAEISAGLPALRAFAPLPHVAALGPGEGQVVPAGNVEHSNFRLLNALERLEKRIYELEHTAHPPLPASQPAPTVAKSSGGDGLSGNGDPRALIEKGQALLNEDKAEEALAAFEEVLRAEPENAEVLVKKGIALERLRRLEEAIACYDLAIAADNTLTIAYLHKGGLFNRLERFSEALECYEQALRTQEKRAGLQAGAPSA